MQCDEAFKQLYDIVVRLRGPGGCPWDIEQTPLSLTSDLVEETYECVEAVVEGDPSHVKEELGDVFQAALLIAYIYEQEGRFSAAEALEGVCEKLIRRHPHVFAGTGAKDTAEVLKNWEKIKTEQEGRKPKDSILDELRGMPPLDRAWKLQKKAAKAGFDWPDIAGVIAKLKEELEEVEDAIASAKTDGSDSNIEEELGDLLFSVVNLCRFLKIDPSLSLQKTNRKFVDRFRHVEKRMKEYGQEMKAENLELMDQYWNEAKKN